MAGLKEALDKFNNDKNVKKIVESQTIFDILHLKETGCSQILAWLMDPRESHNLGNKFILDILRQIENENKKICVQTPCKKNCKRYLERDNKLFRNSIVLTEYVVDNGRIDILAMDYENDLCLVIENKYGSKIHNNQLQKYKTDLFNLCENNKNINFIFVYLDPSDIKGANNEFDGWKVLNYRFILDFIKKNSQKSIFVDVLKAFETDISSFNYVTYFKDVMKVADRYSDVLMRMDKGFSNFTEYFKSADTKLQKYLKATYKNNEYFIDDAKLYLNNKEIFNLYYKKEFRELFSNSRNGLILGERTIFNKGEIDFTTRILEDASRSLWFAYGKISYKNKKFSVTINVEKDFFSGSIQKYNEIKKVRRKIDNNSPRLAIVEVIQILYKMSDILKK